MRHGHRSEYNQWNTDCSKHQQNWGVWECSKSASRGPSTLRNFLGSKEHVDWFKIDLNPTEIITIEDYKCKQTDVDGSRYIQCQS